MSVSVFYKLTWCTYFKSKFYTLDCADNIRLEFADIGLMIPMKYVIWAGVMFALLTWIYSHACAREATGPEERRGGAKPTGHRFT